MIAEVDTRAGRRRLNDGLEDVAVLFGGQQIRNESGDAAGRRGASLRHGIAGRARPRDIGAMAEMEMDVEAKNHIYESTQRLIQPRRVLWLGAYSQP